MKHSLFIISSISFLLLAPAIQQEIYGQQQALSKQNPSLPINKEENKPSKKSFTMPNPELTEKIIETILKDQSLVDDIDTLIVGASSGGKVALFGGVKSEAALNKLKATVKAVEGVTEICCTDIQVGKQAVKQ